MKKVEYLNEIPVIFDESLNEKLDDDYHYYIEDIFRNDIDPEKCGYDNALVWELGEMFDYAPDLFSKDADINDPDLTEEKLEWMQEAVWNPLIELLKNNNCTYECTHKDQFEGNTWRICGKLCDLKKVVSSELFFDLLGDYNEDDFIFAEQETLDDLQDQDLEEIDI